MSEYFGLTKLALLNTAGYAKCVLPLDKSVSVSAPNNTGKSSVINALQFPLINDLRLTEWDGHDLDDTRKFYFSTDKSYILLEANLPKGPVVIGVAGLGKAAGYAHQFFCYKGKLDLGDFTQGKELLKYSKLFVKLHNAEKQPLELKPSELNAMLIGGATPYDSQLSLKMIPLNNTSDAPVYKEIFRRILNLHQLGASDVKRFVLRVFERHMSNARVDFLAVWNDAFEKVSRARSQLQALEAQADSIRALDSMVENRAVLKGKIGAFQPKLDMALAHWYEFQEGRLDDARARLNEIQEEKSGIGETHRLYRNQLKDIAVKRAEQSQWITEYDALYQEFSLVDEQTLGHNIQALKLQYEEMSGALSGAKSQSLANIELKLKDSKRRLASSRLTLKNLEYNLYSRLREDLSMKEVTQLSKLLNPDLLSLATVKGGEIEISDDAAFSDFIEQLADAIRGETLHLPGAQIQLTPLTAASFSNSEDKQALKQQIDMLEQDVASLQSQADIAANLETRQHELEALYQELKQEEDGLKRFHAFQSMQTLYQEKQALLAGLDEEEAGLEEKADSLSLREAELTEQASQYQAQLEQFKRQEERLAQVKSERIDANLDLISGKVTPYLLDIRLDQDNLADDLHHFNRECLELRNIDINIHNTYLSVHNAGVTKFEVETDAELKYEKLIAAFHNLDKEKEIIQRQSRAALVEVASTIKGLREDLNRLEREMNSFNRGIGNHQISNLKDFKVEIVSRKVLVGHIDKIIATSDLYSSGESFDLLNQSHTSDDDALNEAKDYLIQMGSDKGGMSLSDLFDIRFRVVNRMDEVDYYDKIDSAGSNGTRITIKLLCGMLFIRHLLAEKERGKYRIPIYIDEAADIDPANQQAIIDTAMNFGFVPVFASVKPQISCDYIVPIRTVMGGKQNMVDEKDWVRVEDLNQPNLEQSA